MRNVRVFFKKLGAARYISHLDLNRCMQRAIRRSGLEVAYTAGYNPHIALTFALPIPLGFESLCESMDFKVSDGTDDAAVVEKLRGALPAELEVYAAGEPKRKPDAIYCAEYDVTFVSASSSGSLMPLWEEFFSQEKIEVLKPSKKGDKLTDIKPDITPLSVSETGVELGVSLRCRAGTNYNVNPLLLTSAFIDKTGKDFLPPRVTRTALLCEDLSTFE